MPGVRIFNTAIMKFFFAIAFLLFCSAPAPRKKIKLWLIGDSTMSVKDKRAYPETGWGMPFVVFFDSTVSVSNHAKNGRSTKSFLEEGLWKPVLENLQNGDYVFIQFGHNDEVKEKVGRYTTPQEFKNNLQRYVNDTRVKKAIPILLTPVARRAFDSTGRIIDTHAQYAHLVREVALAEGVPLIDLNEKSKRLFEQFGPQQSKLFFNHLDPGEHPNYPEGKIDDTHFNELGARKIAELVLAEIRNLKLELAERIVGSNTVAK